MERELLSKGYVRRLWLAALICLMGSSPERAGAEVFYSQEEALYLAFPNTTNVEQRSVLLTPQQRVEIEERAKSALPGSIMTFFVGLSEGVPVGYAVIDSHTVRSMTQTVMVVLSANGEVERTVVLAFHEPAEYLAPEPWLELFRGRALTDDLWPGREVPRIAGSTLTTNSITGSIRRAKAAHQVLIQVQPSEAH